MAKKIITLITPVHNKAPYIKTWAEGLAKQTYLDKTKILVTDDGSTDDSLELVKKYVAEYNLPAEITENGENLGLMYTIKQAYRKIDTEYFTVLDADDYYISPQKIEKAVKFLESHPDYSFYACNTLLEAPDGSLKPQRPNEKSGATYPQLDGAPFFQTASTTFRNYFSPELLDAIDEETGNAKRHFFQGDAFRNVLAFHFGKLYFENSFDCVWRQKIGIWGKTSPVSQELSNMKSYYKYYDFLKSQFGEDNNARTCLGVSYLRYTRILNYVMQFFSGLQVTEFVETTLFKNILEEKDNIDFNSVLNDLTEQYKLYAAAKLKVIVSD